MSYLLDTDILSRFKRDTIPAKLAAWLQAHETDSFLSVVALAEMRYGVQLSPEDIRDKLARRIDEIEEKFAESIEWLDVDILLRWKQLLAELKSVNRTMTCEDSLLAASALARGHTLATNNTRHFEPAKQFGLAVVNPLA